MLTDVICGVITFLGVILSSVITANRAKKVTIREIEKLKMTWNREDSITFSENIEELTRLVYNFTSCHNDTFAIPAISKTAEMRINATGEVAAALDELYTALSQRNRLKAEQQLSEVIKIKALTNESSAKDQQKQKSQKGR